MPSLGEGEGCGEQIPLPSQICINHSLPAPTPYFLPSSALWNETVGPLFITFLCLGQLFVCLLALHSSITLFLCGLETVPSPCSALPGLGWVEQGITRGKEMIHFQ